MMLNKISKIQKKENIIASFWIFFEESIVKYKGINKENFFYYLKEIEFKFIVKDHVTKKLPVQRITLNYCIENY